METLLQRIYNELKYLNKVKNQTDFGAQMEYNKSFISTLLKRSAPLHDTLRDKLHSVFGIAYAWMDNYSQQSDPKKMFDNTVDGPPKARPTNEGRQIPHEEFMEVLYLPRSGQAGYATAYADNHPYDNLDTMLVTKEYEKGNYLVAEIVGHSMDNGSALSLLDEDRVLLKEIPKESWHFLLPIKKFLFFIVSSESVMCKQIIDHDLVTRTIVCHSFDPTEKDFTLSLDAQVLQIFIIKKLVERKLRF